MAWCKFSIQYITKSVNQRSWNDYNQNENWTITKWRKACIFVKDVALVQCQRSLREICMIVPKFPTGSPNRLSSACCSVLNLCCLSHLNLNTEHDALHSCWIFYASLLFLILFPSVDMHGELFPVRTENIAVVIPVVCEICNGLP